MSWAVRLQPAARKALASLDKPVQRRIVAALERLGRAEDPAALCKTLSGPLAGLWRYRVGDWRLVCEIQRGQLVVLVITIGHRADVYG